MTEWSVQDLKKWYSTFLKSGGKSKKLENVPCDYETFAYQLLKKTKLLSQLIASSWLEDDTATKIREIFTQFATGQDDSELRALFTGRKPDLWNKPIFDDEEIELYRFEISWDVFEGKVLENHQAVLGQQPPYFTAILPYPPRPVLSKFTVTQQQIQDWVNSPLQEEQNGLLQAPYPPYPYIPLTTT